MENNENICYNTSVKECTGGSTMLKSANKTETNTYTLEVSISGEDFKAAIVKAYNKQL